MPSPKARVAILWHMHQPYYRDLLTGRCSLPWVRLHAVKDYHPMGVILSRFPGVHVTINVVPSLIKQILEYTEEGLRDDFWDVTAVRADELDAEQRSFIIRNFFMANWNLAIKPNQRYAELLEKRGFSPTGEEVERAAEIFSVQDILDLQVLFNLVWFHPIEIEQDQRLSGLIKRGRNFTEDDKNYILDRQLEIMNGIVPLYRELRESGQIEISTSPFYHPIMPLLLNMESAREAMPSVELPSPIFSSPEDAALQLDRAIEYHREIFGEKPRGLWPSEGSVSEDIVPLVIDRGFTWMASDEDILYRSRGIDQDSRPLCEKSRCRLLYRPYILERDGRSLSMVFRDHLLSDNVGFTYGHWDPAAAAADLAGEFQNIAGKCAGMGFEPLISIILDGENPWEYYPAQGYPFLCELYGKLEKSSSLRAVTVSEALAESTPADDISRLFAGSWINHNFQIWIGHAEDRRAWEMLSRTRDVLDELKRAPAGSDGENYKKAQEEILIAEGSDWCWWYGDENSSGNDEAFDELFRGHLQNVYKIAGKDVPDELKVTVFTGKREWVPITKIYSFINPVIDGRVSSYFEWLAAGEYSIDYHGTMMHRADIIISAVYFGFNAENLFIRIDPSVKIMANDTGKYVFTIHFLRPNRARLEIAPVADGSPGLSFKLSDREEEAPAEKEGLSAAIRDVLEVSVPFGLLGADIGEQVDFFVSLAREGHALGHWPHQGYLSVSVPSEDFEEKIWSI